MSNILSLKFILIFGIILRLASIIYFGDSSIDNEWGILLDNLYRFNIISFWNLEGAQLPSAFMPPLYLFFLFFFKSIIAEKFLILLILISQMIFGILAIIIVYETLKVLYQKNTALIGASVFCLYPSNIYAVSQISSISLQLFLLCFFFYNFVLFDKNFRIKHLVFLSITSAMLILCRGEFIAFFIFTVLFFFLKTRKLNKTILILITTTLLISPYLLRNYFIFDTFTITHSTGYNLLKGNNPKSKVEGIRMLYNVDVVVPQVKEKINLVKFDDKYEISIDKIYMEQALNFIKEDPKKYFILYIKKFLSFLFLDLNSSYPNYYHFLHIIPKLLMAVLTMVAIVKNMNFTLSIYNYFVLYYFANIALLSVFFILPRYSLSLLFVQIVIILSLIEKPKLVKA